MHATTYVPSREQCTRRRTVPSRRRATSLAAILGGVLAAGNHAQAIDYGVGGSALGRSASGHAMADEADDEPTSATTVTFEMCTGDAGCCCTNDITDCTPVGKGGQTCDNSNHCIGKGYENACCHHRQTSNHDPDRLHQSCCADDGPSEICCREGAAACSYKIVRARVCVTGTLCCVNGDSCGVGSDLVATLCDDSLTGCDESNAPPCCPGTGGRLDVALSVGSGANQFPKSYLQVLDKEQLSVYIEFAEDEDPPVLPLVAPITSTKPPQFGIPTMSATGLAGLTVMLTVAGAVLIHRRRSEGRIAPQ